MRREEEAGETIVGLFPPLVSRLASLGESLPRVHGIQVAINGAGIDRLPVGAIAVGKLFVRPHEAVIVLRLQALRRDFVHFPDFFPAANCARNLVSCILNCMSATLEAPLSAALLSMACAAVAASDKAAAKSTAVSMDFIYFASFRPDRGRFCMETIVALNGDAVCGPARLVENNPPLPAALQTRLCGCSTSSW